MSNSKVDYEDEIGLFEFFGKIRDGWRVVVLGGAIGAVCMILALGLMKPTFEAVAVIQVGQVGRVGQIDPVGRGVQVVPSNVVEVSQIGQFTISSRLVEPPLKAIERMNSPAFLQRVAQSSDDLEWVQVLNSPGSRNEVSIQVIEGKGREDLSLIKLRVKARSQESARQRATAVVAELIREHTRLAEPALESIRTALSVNQERLAKVEDDLIQLNKQLNAAGIQDGRFSQLVLMTSLRMQKETEAFGLRQMIMALKMAMEQPATQAARSIEAVFVPEKPVSPNKLQLLTLGILSGLLAGVGWVFISDAWRRARVSGVDR